MRPGPRRLPRGPPAAPQPVFTPSTNLSRAFDLAGRRDSDASSLCSSLPSSAGGRPSLLLPDRSSQSSALSYVNSSLSVLGFQFALRPPLPSAKDITLALRFLCDLLEYPISKSLEDELPVFLRLMNCPCKPNKSALKAPGTPHSWPSILSVLYWLTQLVEVQVHSSQSEDSEPPYQPTDLESYISQSYSLFLSGDDAAVEELDGGYVSKVRAHNATSIEHVESLETELKELEEKLATMTQGPSRKEVLEEKRSVLMEDRRKFEAVVQSYAGRVEEMKETMAVLKAELSEKEMQIKKCKEEREELRKRIGEQGVNVRDVERMRREMQSIEKGIEEAINGKSSLEEKAWEVEAGIVKMLDQLEILVGDCNQALKKLKLEVDFQYVLNTNGSSPAEVIGKNYKTTLKPALKTLDEDFKKSSVSKLEESISLRGELEETSKLVEEKKKNFTNLTDKLQEIEGQIVLVKNETEKNRSKFAAEIDELKAEMERKENELTIVETQAQEFLKMAEMKKMNAKKETEEEIQMCFTPLLSLIDSVTDYMEFMESAVDDYRSDLSELIADVAEMSKNLFSTSSVLGVKRARFSKN
ncbi:hypothetical protein LUZ60_010195 [Juncus effusus]|nr:hypothetical protein LUZ60_010195 [Juncus effusus]